MTQQFHPRYISELKIRSNIFIVTLFTLTKGVEATKYNYNIIQLNSRKTKCGESTMESTMEYSSLKKRNRVLKHVIMGLKH